MFSNSNTRMPGVSCSRILFSGAFRHTPRIFIVIILIFLLSGALRNSAILLSARIFHAYPVDETVIENLYSGSCLLCRRETGPQHAVYRVQHYVVLAVKRYCAGGSADLGIFLLAGHFSGGFGDYLNHRRSGFFVGGTCRGG